MNIQDVKITDTRYKEPTNQELKKKFEERFSLDEKIEEIKKEYEDLFTKPFEDTDDWVAHDSEKVWAWFESKLQKEREEAVRGFVREIIGQLPAFPKGSEMEESIRFWLGLISRAKEAYLSQTKGGGR